MEAIKFSVAIKGKQTDSLPSLADVHKAHDMYTHGLIGHFCIIVYIVLQKIIQQMCVSQENNSWASSISCYGLV